uniref:Uncharacterized protein LOC104229761 n=1 Tax=Nicotiana sylvestris TaxID=4096 RepID=A0A1U7WLB4_NICSY|nr:PREDICTED: uncharacterized protein LOC104229761 [Nicotiana sylvestris]
MGTDTLNCWMVSSADYFEFLQYKAGKQISFEIASVVQTSNSVTCVSQSSSSESWVIDSAVSRLAKSLKCAFLFLDDHAFIQERNTRRIIGTGRESNGFYYLILAKLHGLTSCLPSPTCPVTDSPALLHKRLGHPRTDRLAPHALKCVFFGFSRVKGGINAILLTSSVTISHPSSSTSPAPPSIAPIPPSIAPVQSPIGPVPPHNPVQPSAASPLLTYHPRPHPALGPGDSRPASGSVSTADLSPLSQPIALCKGAAMIDEMSALHASDTWELVPLPADIKNAFLHSDLDEEVYMEQPPGFVAQGEFSGCVCRLRRSLYGLKQSPQAWFGKFNTIIQEFDMTRSEADHSVFYRHSAPNLCIYLDGITNLEKHLFEHFQTKDLGSLKPVDSPMDPNAKLLPGQGSLLETLRDIGAPGKGLLFEDRGHEQIVGYIDADWAGSPFDRRSTSGYCVLVGGNLVSWKSKKQNVVARSSAEAEYRAMAMATCELVWVKQLLKELKFGEISRMELSWYIPDTVKNRSSALVLGASVVFLMSRR